MFCSKCGKEISEGAAFCPNCGNQIGLTNHVTQTSASVGSSNLPASSLPRPKKKRKSAIIIGIVLVIAVTTLFFARTAMEENAVKIAVNYRMEEIKTGVSDETIDILIQNLVNSTDNRIISFLGNYVVDGSDINDIYYALVNHLYYETRDVKKIEKDHYQVQIYVENTNNRIVFLNAINSIEGDFSDSSLWDKLSLGYEIYQNDITKYIATKMIEEQEKLDAAFYVSGIYTLDIYKSDGKWLVSDLSTEILSAWAGIQ